MLWPGGLTRLVTRSVTFLGIVVLCLGVFFTQTPRGKELVFREVLRRIEGGLAGTIEVAEISSPGLFGESTFRGVRIVGEDGRPFLVADSIRARIFPPPLFRGDLVFTRVALWGPEVRLERLPDQPRMNVSAIFAPPPPGDTAAEGSIGPDSEAEVGEELDQGEGLHPRAEGQDSAPGVDSIPVPLQEPGQRTRGRTIAIRDVEIHDGNLHILLPAPASVLASGQVPVEFGEDGRPSVRRRSFLDIQLAVSDFVVRSPHQQGERFRVDSLSFRGEVWPNPFSVENLVGQVIREPGRLNADLEEARLAASQAQGSLEVGWGEPLGTWVSVQGTSDGLSLRDLWWLEPRLPAGRATGPFELQLRNGDLLLDFLGTRLSLPPGNLRARGGLRLGTPLELENLNLDLTDVDLDVLDPWLPEPLPLGGLAGGVLFLDGGPADLTVDADLTLLRPDSSGMTEAQITGTFHQGDSLGVTDLMATFAPLDWGTFGDMISSQALQGPGALRMEANGFLPSGISINAEATHVPTGLPPSRVTGRGTVQRTPEAIMLNVNGELSPLSFTSLGSLFPDLPLTGEISGPVSFQGPLSDVTVQSELLTSAGPLGFRARFDARNPANRYSVESDFQEFLLSRLVPKLPDPTRLTGRVVASGSGISLESLAGNASAFLRRGEVGSVQIDTAMVQGTVSGGLLRLDSLLAETNLGWVRAGGGFGISSDSRPGVLTVEVESQSLEGLRPFFMGEIPLIREDLTSFEEGLLIAEGVDLDTIPSLEEVALDGRLQGRAVLEGGLGRFSGEGEISVEDLRYRSDFLKGGRFTFSGFDFPGEDLRLDGVLETDSLSIREFSFIAGEAELNLGRHDGRVRAIAIRSDEEEYRAGGTFALDTLVGRVDLDELTLRFDSVRWNLGGPASVLWSPQGTEVRDFRLIRPGVGGMRIRADGYLPLRGDGDFELEVEGLQLDRVARFTQMDDPLEGLLHLRMRVGGTAESPSMVGTLSGESLRFREYTLAGLDSEFEYRDQRLTGEAWALEGGRQVLAVEGSFPADLRVRPESGRLPEAPVDLTVAVDSFPAALALVTVRALEEVDGALSGQFQLGGTPAQLAPVGALHLGDGSTFVPGLGVRFQEVDAAFALNPDGTVQVEGTFQSQGTGRVNGTVFLHPLTDPTLDLTLSATELLAVARRDVEARVTGQVEITQRYRLPRVEGSLRVDGGVLMVEEFARSAEVVDLSDPSFLNVMQEAGSLRPMVEATQNPFLQNLRLDVELSMSRGSWLRGKDMNVEMNGDLQVFWDRTERDLAMVGELEAIRGFYTVLGRQFQVQEGGVSFIGTAGVNPNLDLEALHRLRTPEDEDLEVTATVEGTLLSPRISLSSNANYAIAESDLVSYLIFGRPTYALASGQNNLVQGAAGSLLGAAGGATANLALGTMGSQLGSVVARDFGLDYLAISQGDYIDPFAGAFGWGSTLAATQVEIGQYLTEDLFAALIWRPLGDLGSGNKANRFAGLRLEWRPLDFWTLEGFYEDQLARSPLFRSIGFQQPKILGFFFWREWGY